jgi:hypothetical protein
MFKQAQHDEQTINVLCCNYPNEDELDNPQIVMDDVVVDTLHQVIIQNIFYALRFSTIQPYSYMKHTFSRSIVFHHQKYQLPSEKVAAPWQIVMN